MGDLLAGLPEPEGANVERIIFTEHADNDLTVHFGYANFDAEIYFAREHA
jgi:hypothetical protein